MIFVRFRRFRGFRGFHRFRRFRGLWFHRLVTPLHVAILQLTVNMQVDLRVAEDDLTCQLILVLEKPTTRVNFQNTCK